MFGRLMIQHPTSAAPNRPRNCRLGALARLGPALGLLMALASGCATMQRAAADEPRGERLGRELTAQIAEIMATNHIYETAVPLLREGIAEDPNNARLHRLLGTVLRDRGVFDQALTELQLAWTLAPNDPDTAAAIGVLYDATERPEAAEMWHRHALLVAGRRGDLYNNLGFSLFLQNRNAEAMVTFKEALRYNPNQARAFNNLGFTYFRLGEPEMARRSFQQAGTRAMASANMGVAYEMEGDPVAAAEAYREALRLDRRLEVARKNLLSLTARRDERPAAASRAPLR